jgi:hypothetical protein
MGTFVLLEPILSPIALVLLILVLFIKFPEVLSSEFCGPLKRGIIEDVDDPCGSLIVLIFHFLGPLPIGFSNFLNLLEFLLVLFAALVLLLLPFVLLVLELLQPLFVFAEDGWHVF